ncbi:MAG TPA: DUF445 domain-containing protein [Nevskiaceae bacterium]
MHWAGLQEIFADFQAHWPIYASMPLVAALIGYFTKVVAIRMMFRPLTFVGIRPFLGWQGVVPRHAARMASVACDTLTSHLLDPAELFARLDPERIARELEGPLLHSVRRIAREVANQYAPGLWERLPGPVRDALVARLEGEAPGVIARILDDIKGHVESVFDLKDMVVTNLVRDRALLNRMFLDAGAQEFRFIRNCGALFGLLIGAVQLIAWGLTREPLIMPLFGLVTGWLTDWLALRMVFYPREPRTWLGVFRWQGLFLKHRARVSAAYGRLIAEQVITPRKVLEAILRGPLADRLFALVHKRVQDAVGQQLGLAAPVVEWAIGSRRYREVRQTVAREVIATLPAAMQHIEAYAADAMDLEALLVEKMQGLSVGEYEGLLRPIFRQDEWKLIAVGALLGFVIGELQVLVVEHFSAPAAPAAHAALGVLRVAFHGGF